FFETQKIRECLEVFGDRAGQRTGRWLGHTAAPTSPVKCDHPVARLLEGWNVVLPAVAVTSVRVQQNHGDAAAAGVRKPESNSGQLGISLARGSRRCPLERNETAGAHAEQRNRDDPSYPGTESMHHFFRIRHENTILVIFHEHCPLWTVDFRNFDRPVFRNFDPPLSAGHARQTFKQCPLACSVRTNQPRDFSSSKLKADNLERIETTEAFRQTTHFENRRRIPEPHGEALTVGS